MININKLKKIKCVFPIVFGKNVISAKICRKLIWEISNAKSFDDLIQGGRNRINKGSKNFKDYLKKSEFSNKLYKQFNSEFFFKKIEDKFKKTFPNYDWNYTFKQKKFLKHKYTKKNLMNSKELSRMYGKNYSKKNVNLDFDFSASVDGYKLKPHRDDITRIYNFLIYLNDIPKKSGGALTIFKFKGNNKIRRIFKRFPNINKLNKIKEFIPYQGSVVFIQSTPNSYHGVSLYKENQKRKRFFIYGSYALSGPVIWKYKNLTYLPKIKKTNKRLLTSSHNTDYILKK